MALSAAEVAAFAGRSDDVEYVAAAGKALPVVMLMVQAYVRRRGYLDAALEAVVLSSTARLASNPEGIVAEALGDYSVRPGTFTGWTLPELAILNAYRVRAR